MFNKRFTSRSKLRRFYCNILFVEIFIDIKATCRLCCAIIFNNTNVTCTLFADDELDQFRSVQERAGPLAFMREMAARAEQRTAEIGNKLLDQQLTDNMIQELREHTGQGQYDTGAQGAHRSGTH